MADPLGQVKQLRVKLLLLLVIVFIALAALVPFVISSLNERNALNSHIQSIKKITSDIIYYDEVLTMSSRMFTFTQEEKWSRRYLNIANTLDQTLLEAEALDPIIADAIAATAQVNTKLIEIESKAFALARAGKLELAQRILLDDTYFALKSQYQATVFKALDNIRAVSETNMIRQNEFKTHVLLLSLLGLALLFMAFIAYLFRHNRQADRYMGELLKSRNDSIAKLNATSKDLEQASKAKSQLLANMSHELRTPINGLYGALQLLRKEPQSNESVSLLDTATMCSEMLSTLVNDILDFTQIEKGKLQLEVREFDLRRVSKTIEHIFRQECEQKKLRFNCAFNVEHPLRLGDELRLKQVLVNLLSNAVKFTERGRISLSFTAASDSQWLAIVISDTGAGIKEEVLSKLFTHFEQGDASATRLYSGVGLGLAIVKSLVDAMHGTINITSQSGSGTSVELSLPLALPEKTTKEADEEVESEPQKTDDATLLQGLSILIVEDNAVNQIILQKMLVSQGAKTALAVNGQEAIDKMSADIQLILMDIQMPVMGGVEAFQEIRSQWPVVPVIAVTANVFESDISQYIRLGFDGVVAKPISQSVLTDTILTNCA
ncbi:MULTISPECIES: ATP-binding protein [unclassified Pseudoalteromonas]|uniref:ATP-binding protein n=1 Tax=unclassified Pseudoalteromonas TaxID=194690 RepID=UPI002097FE92|nr:ATP-binding protein [Pseudoalteromonas sp. XMcav2-N]MCO7189054.1 ATP-binding protein [Pseudoalteromonas sp. XMcav2-N]